MKYFKKRKQKKNQMTSCGQYIMAWENMGQTKSRNPWQLKSISGKLNYSTIGGNQF